MCRSACSSFAAFAAGRVEAGPALVEIMAGRLRASAPGYRRLRASPFDGFDKLTASRLRASPFDGFDKLTASRLRTSAHGSSGK